MIGMSQLPSGDLTAVVDFISLFPIFGKVKTPGKPGVYFEADGKAVLFFR
jgi:hypothetical protein